MLAPADRQLYRAARNHMFVGQETNIGKSDGPRLRVAGIAAREMRARAI